MLQPDSIDFMTLPSVPLDDRATLPNIAAIYFVLSEANTILYIGRSKALSSRWKTHGRLSQLTKLPHIRIAWLAVSSPGLLPEIEKACIQHFQPEYNGHGDGETVSVILRMSKEQAEAAHELARQEQRSLQGQMLYLLEAWMTQAQARRPPRRAPVA